MISAPGKLILCGEHAVVYGSPAIAIPFSSLRARAVIQHERIGTGLTLAAPDLRARWKLRASTPLSELARQTLARLNMAEPDATIRLHSDIPIASGMGSGAAIGAALVQAIARLAGRTLDPATISELVYESERAFHGTPSGIDNTVVAYEQPLLFHPRAGQEPRIQPLAIGGPWRFVVADSGVSSETKAVVDAVRQGYLANRPRYEGLFSAIANIVWESEAALRANDGLEFGALLNANQRYLVELGVSSPELDRLVGVARSAGAWGAKLSGAGWGGIMIALTDPDRGPQVDQALRDAGAIRTWTTGLGSSQ